MISITGIPIDRDILRDLKKVCDILEYDGPILRHYQDKYSNNYLFFWIDADSDYNRWIIWKSELYRIINYVEGVIDFKSLFESSDKSYYIADIDSDANYSFLHQIYHDEIPEQYMPIEGDYYKDAIPNVYTDKFELVALNADLADLFVSRTLVFKLNPADRSLCNMVNLYESQKFLKIIYESIDKLLLQSFEVGISNNLVNIIRRFTVQIIQEYLAYVFAYKDRVRLMGVNLRDTELLIWAEINDDDDEVEGKLFIDEARVNAKFLDKQISISTTIVEKSDCISMPNQYLTIFSNA